MEFKDRLKSLRAEKGINTTTLAAQFGKSDTAVRMWETGRSKPDVDTLIKLATYFDCTTDYLLGLSGYKNSEHEKASRDAQDMVESMREQLNPAIKITFWRIETLILESYIFLSDKAEPLANELMGEIFNTMLIVQFYCETAARVMDAGWDVSGGGANVALFAAKLKEMMNNDIRYVNDFIPSALKNIFDKIASPLPDCSPIERDDIEKLLRKHKAGGSDTNADTEE